MKEDYDEMSKKAIRRITEEFPDDSLPTLIVVPAEAERNKVDVKISKNCEIIVKRGQFVTPGTSLAVEYANSGDGTTPARRRKKSDAIYIDSPIDGEVTHIKQKEGVITIEEIFKINMPYGAHIEVQDGEEVQAGDILAKIPRESQKVKDITGGLPRVVELFEARKPQDAAIISEVDGRVRLAGVQKGAQRVIIEYDMDGQTHEREYLIPKGVHITVKDGDEVRTGEPLMVGSPNPHDILRTLGDTELQRYLVNEIQNVYRVQGVTINDKHIETIVRQMLRLVRIDDPGDTDFLIDQQVDRFEFEEENERVLAQNGRPATGEPLLLGITKASLSTESFISAASFQETTRILTEASTQGKIDRLRGLKENIVVGRLIPAGTGYSGYRRVKLLTRTAKPMPDPVRENPFAPLSESGNSRALGE